MNRPAHHPSTLTHRAPAAGSLLACGLSLLVGFGLSMGLGGCSDTPPPVVVFPDSGPPVVFLCSVDAQCADGVYCNGDERCAPDDSEADARGCAPADVDRCLTGQSCSEADLRCVNDCAVETDADGDGAEAMACGGNDCDDNDANRFPGNPEICDAAGHDEDCDDATFGERDTDGDGFTDAACCNGTNCGDDCDDMDASLRPNGAEACDGLDNDCDGSTDEGVNQTFFPDADGDGYGEMGSTASTMSACSLPDGFSTNALDCDDTAAAVNPGAFDRCDGTVDDDCSGAVDDPAGGCSCETGQSRPCPLPGVCGSGSQDCVAGLWTACTIAPTGETCNGLDDDCNGTADELCPCAIGATVPCGTDVGVCSTGVRVCDGSGAFSACITEVSPGTELCNGADDDCDGSTDENAPDTLYFEDVDGDGVGVATSVMALCGPQPTGFSPIAGDCWPDDAEHVCEDNEYPAGAYGPGFVTALTLSTTVGGDLIAWLAGNADDGEYVLGYSPGTDPTAPWTGRSVEYELPGGGALFLSLDAGATALVGGSDLGTYYWRFDAMGQTGTPERVVLVPDSQAIALDFNGDQETDLVRWDGMGAEGLPYSTMVAGLGASSTIRDCTTSCPRQAVAVREAPGVAQDVIVVDADGGLTRYHYNDVNVFEVVANGGATLSSAFVNECATADLTSATEDEVVCWSSGDLQLATVDSTMSTSYVQATQEVTLGFVQDVAVVDFNNDGVDELLVAENDAVLLLTPGTALGDFTPVTLWDGSATQVLAHDVDGDGDLDVLVVESDLTLTFIENRGGRFAPAGSPTGTLP